MEKENYPANLNAISAKENSLEWRETGEFAVKIEPRRSVFDFDWREFWSFRELLYFLAWRDVKVRYKQTVLGAAWVLLQPAATTLIFTVLFGRFVQPQTGEIPYWLFAFSGFVVWTFFNAAILNASNSLTNHTNLITKVYFPRLIVPLAATGANLVDFAVSLAVLLVVVIFFWANLSWKLLLAPLFLSLIVLLAVGAGIFLAALNVRFRDIKQLLPFALQFLLFLSPVFYPLETVPERWRVLWSLNPLVGALQGFRASLFGTDFDLFSIVISVVMAAAIFFAALVVFRKLEENFADVI